MKPLPFRRFAPVLDLACLMIFVAIGREQHDLNSTGFTWYLTVLWPLVAGFAIGALVTKLYAQPERWWFRLVGTIAIAALVDALLRGTFTGRGYVSAYTIVLFLFINLVTFVWRLVWLSVARWRRTVPAS